MPALTAREPNVGCGEAGLHAAIFTASDATNGVWVHDLTIGGKAFHRQFR
jgi:hypothetical protein